MVAGIEDRGAAGDADPDASISRDRTASSTGSSSIRRSISRLFRELASAGLVDGIDVAIIPILLGGGLPLLPAPAPRMSLQLRTHRVYAKTGTLFLEYDVRR